MDIFEYNKALYESASWSDIVMTWQETNIVWWYCKITLEYSGWVVMMLWPRKHDWLQCHHLWKLCWVRCCKIIIYNIIYFWFGLSVAHENRLFLHILILFVYRKQLNRKWFFWLEVYRTIIYILSCITVDYFIAYIRPIYLNGKF